MPIAEAILDARWRGIDVDVFLEQDYLRSELKARPTAARQPTSRRDAGAGVAAASSGASDETRPVARPSRWRETVGILAALLRNDIEVHGDFNPKIFHQKFILRDYREARRCRPRRC